MAVVDIKAIENELDSLERAIALLKRDYEIFFAGASKQPPNDHRDKLDKAIKKMGTTQGLSYALRFRYNSILSRFNSYVDLWNKQLRTKEEGRSPARVPGLKHRTAEQPPKTEGNGAPQEKEPDRIQKIYEEYLRARTELGEGTNVTLEGFVQVIAKQKQAIIEKLHCKDVEFYVAVEAGKTKLKARPVK